MRNRQIVSGTIFLILICVVLRTLHSVFTVDAETGFVKNDYGVISSLLIFGTVFAAIVCAVMGYTTKRRPCEMPKSPILAVSSFLLSVALVLELLVTSYPTRVPQWQVTLMTALGGMTAVFFVLYGIFMFIKAKLPSLLFVIPVFYGMIKLLVLFTEISSVAIIPENIFSVLSNCAVLLFLLQLAKQANSIKNKKAHKTLMASGIAAMVLCYTVAIPNFFMIAFYPKHSAHYDIFQSIIMLAFGIFINVFIFSIFSNKNILSRTNKKTSRSFMGSSNVGVAFFSVEKPYDELVRKVNDKPDLEIGITGKLKSEITEEFEKNEKDEEFNLETIDINSPFKEDNEY